MKARSWLPPLLWAGAIIFATSLPGSMVPRRLGPFDKVVHFSMYAVLAGLVTAAFRGHRAILRALILAVLAIAVFAAIDEWHQRFVPGRSTELADWVADATGAIVGVITTYFLLSRSPKQSPA